MNIEWDKLGFGFYPVRSNLRFHYADGRWDNGALHSDYNINMSVAANVFHYGQAVFEGMKAFGCRDGKVRIFRPEANARRINASARQLMMPEFPEERFIEAIRRVVADNIDYVPPYESGGSMYIRPVMIGTTPQIGVAASLEYELIIMVMPAGNYYGRGQVKPVDALVSRDFDRAAPHGTGHIKAAGNYAASLRSAYLAKSGHHCPIVLYLDPATHTYIDEFGTSNFFAVDGKGAYVTPDSNSILPSITNDSLRTVAADLGMEVERRKIRLEELAGFTEVAACGTAVVLTPVGRIFDGDKVYDFKSSGMGPVQKRLYEALTGIQRGERDDRRKWMVEV